MSTAPSLAQHLSAWAADSAERAIIADTVRAVADACASLSHVIAAGDLAGNSLGAARGDHGSGDAQKELDVRANEVLVAGLEKVSVAALASEEMAEPIALNPKGNLLVAIDPLDGSSNIDTN